MEKPEVTDDIAPWEQMQATLVRLLAGLGSGEVIELAAAGSFYLEVGRMPREIWLLASGPPTPELRSGQIDAAMRKRLRALGFRPPDKDKPSWWRAVAAPADLVELEQAAAAVVTALQQVPGVTRPDDLVWSHIVATPATRELAAQLGIPRL